MFMLSDSDIERIDADSMRILAEIGVRVDDEELRRQAVGAGAKIGRQNDILCFPPEMVREAVDQAPASAGFADCDGSVTVVGPGRPSTFWTGAALNYVIGNEARPIRSQDLADFARIADSLESVFAVVGTALADVPPPARDVVGLRIMATHTRKHLRPLLFKAENVKAMIEMAEVVADGRPLRQCPLISFGYSCLSPLHWSQISIDLWRNSSGHRLPVMLNGEPITGATSPVTLAGAVAMANAEVLAGVALVQLLSPARPVVHNIGFAHSMDMRRAACLAGSPECALMAAAGARLAAYYKLPSASWMCTDALADDQQAAIEKMLTGAAHAAAGVSVIWGMGQLETEKSLSPVQLVMDDEIVRALVRFARGFQVDDDTLAYGVIRQVETGEGEFLSHDHTIAHFRDELSGSPLLARSTRQRWADGGCTTLADRAKAYVHDLLARPQEPRLTDRQSKDILAIEQRVLKALG